MNDYTIKVRILNLMLLLLARSFRYSITELAEYYKRDRNTIKRDFEALKSAKINLERNKKTNRYAIIPNRECRELRYGCHHSSEIIYF